MCTSGPQTALPQALLDLAPNSRFGFSGQRAAIHQNRTLIRNDVGLGTAADHPNAYRRSSQQCMPPSP
jgi:hypothetical protein